MKRFHLNVIALVLTALHFADTKTQSGAMGGKTTTGYVGAPEARAVSLYDSIKNWTPGEFRNAVQANEVKDVRDPLGNTLLHRALLDDNLAVAQLIVTEYGFIGDDVKNLDGFTCREVAIQKGPEFAGIFADMPIDRKSHSA